MKKRSLLMMVMAVFFLYGELSAQMTAREVIPHMMQGINIGNTMDPPTEGGWNNPPIEEHIFDDYKAAGFQTVRIPITWGGHASWDPPHYSVDADWMNRVEQVVDWALERDLYVIMNMHHENWFFNDYHGGEQRFFSIWWQIIDRFQHKSDKVIFEILNETTYKDEWGNQFSLTQGQVDGVNQGVYDMIREKNPTRIVIYGGKEWSSAQDMYDAETPGDTYDPYLMAYYHSYDPFDFAHECNEQWLTEDGKRFLWNQFSAVNQWSQNTGIPVLLGEFGCRKCVDYGSMIEHYSINVSEAKKYGIAYCAWDDGGNFEIYKRAERGWHNDIKNIIAGDTPPPGCEDADATVISGNTRIEAENFCDFEDVQLEDCNEGGQNVGYINPGSWMAYKINVPAAGNYTVRYRVASKSATGQLQIEAQGGAPVYGDISFTATGDWQNWKTVTHEVPLPAGEQVIAIAAISGGWNINWFEIEGDPVEKFTLSTSTIGSGSGSISLNPAGGLYDIGTEVTATATAESGSTFAGWSGDVNGNTTSVSITMDGNKTAIAEFTKDPIEQYTLSTSTIGSGSGIISLSPAGGIYDEGTIVTATASADGGSTFAGWSGDANGNQESVTIEMNGNKTAIAEFNSGESFVVEAEDFAAMQGIQTEDCSEGGLNVGWTDPGDWMAYHNIDFPAAGTYTVEYRVASLTGAGKFKLEQNSGATVLGEIDVPYTGEWQKWTTVSHTVHIANAGVQNFGIGITEGGFNINWIKFTTGSLKSAGDDFDQAAIAEVKLYPNPVSERLFLEITDENMAGKVEVYNILGKQVMSYNIEGAFMQLDVSSLDAGVYTIRVNNTVKNFMKK